MKQKEVRKKRYSKSKVSKRPEKKDGFTDEKRMECKDSSNDPSWYAADEALLRDAASIPFSWATGTPFDMGNLPGKPELTDSQSNNMFTTPGVQVMYLLPSIGNSMNPTSPVNLASSSLYSFVRHANSGHSNYDAPDLMLYILSMGDVYSYINFLQRCYGFARLYAQGNRYLPKALLRSNFVNTEDVQSHLADFRYGINVLINKAASFAVPADMTLFNRHAFLYSNLYTEGTSIKDQLYMYAPAGFWQFQYDSEQAGSLMIKPFMVSATNSEEMLDLTKSSSIPLYYTVDQLLQFGNELLDPIIASEDMNIMSGDILKAYTSNGIMKLQSLPTDYTVLPSFNIEVLEQMKNATIIPSVPSNLISLNLPNITQSQNKGYLISYPSYTINKYYPPDTTTDSSNRTALCAQLLLGVLAENRLITTTTSDTSPGLVMVNSRLITSAEFAIDVAGSTADVILYPGSEIAIANTIWYYDFYDTSAAILPALKRQNVFYVDVMFEGAINNATQSASGYSVAAFNEQLTKANRHCRLEHFDFHPMIREVIALVDTSGKVTLRDNGMAIDVDNYAVVTRQDVYRLHETALMSMLKVASIAKV